jgi:hypothetical protein
MLTAISVVVFSAAMHPMTVGAGLENIASVHGSGERGGVILTVSAIVKSNGETSGQAMFHDRNTNSKLSIDVTSVQIYFADRTALVIGEVTKATNAYASYTPGFPAAFFVEDNGEGPGALPDEFGDPIAKLPVKFPGAIEGGALLPESESGNLRVIGAETP